MNEIIGWLITALVIVLLLAFVVYIAGIIRLPDKERPKTPTYNRFGEVIDERENPDFHINPGEKLIDYPDSITNEPPVIPSAMK